MVKVCSYNYPRTNEEVYKKYYENYHYELHDFQKWCVEATVTGNHVLISAPTGNGKTFGAEFAIKYFHSKGKKIIYTSPIKALSNEKFYVFTNKYPEISIGLITGDIKINPDANVLIMTTEILLNKLCQLKSSIPNVNSSVSFEMDIERELGCVVFDEIHFINDEFFIKRDSNLFFMYISALLNSRIYFYLSLYLHSSCYFYHYSSCLVANLLCFQ